MKKAHTEADTQKVLYDEKEKEVALILKKGLINGKLREREKKKLLQRLKT